MAKDALSTTGSPVFPVTCWTEIEPVKCCAEPEDTPLLVAGLASLAVREDPRGSQECQSKLCLRFLSRRYSRSKLSCGSSSRPSGTHGSSTLGLAFEAAFQRGVDVELRLSAGVTGKSGVMHCDDNWRR